MNRKFIMVTMCVVAVTLAVALPCLAQPPAVITDYQSYSQDDVVKITGFGWQPGESVSLTLTDINGIPCDPQPPFTNPYAANSDGIFNAEFEIHEPDDQDHTFVLVAEGTQSGSARTVFDDPPHLHFFEDASRTITRDAFAWGATVYARADGLGTTRPCYQVWWIDPNNNIIARHNLDSPPLTNDRNDLFVVPATGPSGIWRAELYQPSNSTACSSSPPLTRRDTLYFDVARIVIIGADDSYIVSHFPNLNTNSTPIVKYILDVNDDPDDTEKTFVHFTIPNLSGQEVVSAKVRMRLLIPPSSARIYNLNRVRDPWDVNTITWNNQPPVSITLTSAQPIPTGLLSINTLIRWDVTSDVWYFADDYFGNYGWRIVDSQGTDPEGTFYSTEVNSLTGNKLNGPVLLIDTRPKPATAVPAMTEWGMILFILLAGLGAVYRMTKQRRTRN